MSTNPDYADVTITLTPMERRMVVNSLATTIENLSLYAHQSEDSLLGYSYEHWMALLKKVVTAEEAEIFIPLFCKYKSMCPHVKKNPARPD